MKSIYLVLTLGAALALASAQPARACTAASLDGKYAFKISGWQGSGAAAVPFAAVGVQTFDGRGGFTATNTTSFGGAVIRNFTFRGAYTVNADCTGSMTADFGNGVTATQDFVIVSKGKKIYGIAADQETTWSGTFRKM